MLLPYSWILWKNSSILLFILQLKNTEPIEALWYLTILKYTETFSVFLKKKKKRKTLERFHNDANGAID